MMLLKKLPKYLKTCQIEMAGMKTYLRIFLNPLEKLHIAKDTLIQFEERPHYIY